MDNFKLSPDQIEELKLLHRNTKNKKIAYRINVIILLSDGYCPEEISKALLISLRTIYRIVNIYKEKGLEGLTTLFYKGGVSKLDPKQEKEFINYLDSNVIRSSLQAVSYIKQTFGIDFTKDGMVITLHRLGYSYKKTKLYSTKADINNQKAFIEQYNEIKRDLGQSEKIYFMDAFHPTHNVSPSYCWSKIGEEKAIDCNTGRQRLNLNGVYSPSDQEVISISSNTINSQSTIELLQKLEQTHPELNKIYVIRDNAKYYCSTLVKEYLKTSKIVFIALPTYSPNLNLIERLWKYFKKKILINRYYSTFDVFKGAVMMFFENISVYKDELKTLMTERFHIRTT
jgi:transposase